MRRLRRLPEDVDETYRSSNTDLPLLGPELKYNTSNGLSMALEVSAGTAGSFDGMHCEIVDKRAEKPGAVIWGHTHGIQYITHAPPSSHQ